MAPLVQHKYVLRLKGIDITSTICSLVTAKRYSYKILLFKYDRKINYTFFILFPDSTQLTLILPNH